MVYIQLYLIKDLGVKCYKFVSHRFASSVGVHVSPSCVHVVAGCGVHVSPPSRVYLGDGLS